LRDAPVFGTCVDCRHCEREEARLFCALAQVALSPSDMAAICINFQPDKRAR
jgi:hypothetical protein